MTSIVLWQRRGHKHLFEPITSFTSSSKRHFVILRPRSPLPSGAKVIFELLDQSNHEIMTSAALEPCIPLNGVQLQSSSSLELLSPTDCCGVETDWYRQTSIEKVCVLFIVRGEVARQNPRLVRLQVRVLFDGRNQEIYESANFPFHVDIRKDSKKACECLRAYSFPCDSPATRAKRKRCEWGLPGESVNACYAIEALLMGHQFGWGKTVACILENYGKRDKRKTILGHLVQADFYQEYGLRYLEEARRAETNAAQQVCHFLYELQGLSSSKKPKPLPPPPEPVLSPQPTMEQIIQPQPPPPLPYAWEQKNFQPVDSKPSSHEREAEAQNDVDSWDDLLNLLGGSDDDSWAYN